MGAFVLYKEMKVLFERLAWEIETRGLEVYGIEVFEKGKIVYRRQFAPDVRYPIYSATKSFTSTAVGLAVQEGKLSVEDSLGELLPGKYMQGLPEGVKCAVDHLPLGRLLTMSVPGFPFRPEGEDWLRQALTCGAGFDREEVFSYSNVPAYLAGVAVSEAVGEHLMEYLTPRLFAPLGIERPEYADDPQGRFYGATGMKLTVHELSRLGQLYMQGGVFDGQRLLSEDWVRAATSRQIANKEGGYGYFFWVDADGFSISGKWGQKCLCCPARQRMITWLGNMPERSGEMLRLVREWMGKQ